MLKIGLALAILVAVGLVIFPQLRSGAALLLPLAPLVICLLIMCPMMMYFGMQGMDNNKHDSTE